VKGKPSVGKLRLQDRLFSSSRLPSAYHRTRKGTNDPAMSSSVKQEQSIDQTATATTQQRESETQQPAKPISTTDRVVDSEYYSARVLVVQQ